MITRTADHHYVYEPGTAAGLALDSSLDEWSGLSNAWTRNIIAIEAEARQQGREEERERVRVALHAVAMEPSRFELLWDKELDAILDASRESVDSGDIAAPEER